MNFRRETGWEGMNRTQMAKNRIVYIFITW